MEQKKTKEEVEYPMPEGHNDLVLFSTENNMTLVKSISSGKLFAVTRRCGFPEQFELCELTE